MKFREKDIIPFLIFPLMILVLIIILATLTFLGELDMSFEEIMIFIGFMAPGICVISVLFVYSRILKNK
ncbi:TPA: hypothetical protein ROY01_005705 [Bacillus toyonensis]|nr:hypothetical protein [Bacillus toyonensis]